MHCWFVDRSHQAKMLSIILHLYLNSVTSLHFIIHYTANTAVNTSLFFKVSD